MGISIYVPYDSDLGADYVVQPADWNGMFDGIGSYLNNVIVPAINSLNSAGGAPVNNGRLYLTSGNPYADSSSSASIYFGPCPNLGNRIAIENPGSGALFTQTFSECSAPLSGLTALLPYDAYVSMLTAMTVQLSITPWTNATTPPTRGTDVAGRPCMNGNTGALWVGAFVAATATTTQDFIGSRTVFNAYNKIGRRIECRMPGPNWNGGVGTVVRAINANTTNGQGRLSFLFADSLCSLQAIDQRILDFANAGSVYEAGLGLDSTTAFNTGMQGLFECPTGSPFQVIQTSATLDSTLAFGSHYLQRLEVLGGTAGNCIITSGGAPNEGMTGIIFN